jgi:hypothetical protein
VRAASSFRLASFLPVKAVQKYDGLLDDNLLDIANGHDRLNVDEAKRVSKETISVIVGAG